ncbi:MAG: hypothetical protein ABIH41_04225 [Nanoarchaeota archaeon]
MQDQDRQMLLAMTIILVVMALGGWFAFGTNAGQAIMTAGRTLFGPEPQLCSDDDGRDTSTLGILTFNEQFYIDTCLDRQRLIEYTCGEDDIPEESIIICPCLRGRCI